MAVSRGTGDGRRPVRPPPLSVRRVVRPTVLALVSILFLATTANAEDFDQLVATCAACHGGASARPASGDVPVLNGQPELFILYQLVYFRQGQRKQAAMNDAVKHLSDDTLRALAKHFSVQPLPPVVTEPPVRARFMRGQALARAQRCAACHNDDFGGRDQMPRLAGQQEAYLKKALQDYRTGARVGTQAAMAQVLTNLDTADIGDLAHYLAHLRP